MGSKKDREKKERWFRHGIGALQRARPGVPQGVYCCPLCVGGFASIEPLSFEDVPPKSIGGRRTVLTCKVCNNRSGRQLDPEVRKAADLREFAEGSRELRATLAADGRRVTTDVRMTSDGLSFVGQPDSSNPADHKAFFERLDQAAETGSPDWGFDMSLRAGYDSWTESLSWLRAGYLIAFAVLGYTYILRPELRPLRTQLENPDKEIIPYLAAETDEHESTVNRIAIVFEPAEMRSVLVQFGSRMVFLPDFTSGLDFFDRLREQPSAAMSYKFVGQPLPWPTRPEFTLDFEPGLLQRYLPPIRA